MANLRNRAGITVKVCGCKRESYKRIHEIEQRQNQAVTQLDDKKDLWK